jgi:hypothetical protein
MQTLPVTVSPGLYDAASKTTASPLSDQEFPMILSNRECTESIYVVCLRRASSDALCILSLLQATVIDIPSGTSTNEIAPWEKAGAEIHGEPVSKKELQPQ